MKYQSQKKYHIKPKRDFGRYGFFIINGERVQRGYVVTDGGIINVMPGATWFRTIHQAVVAIQCLELSGGDARTFWQLMQSNRPEAP